MQYPLNIGTRGSPLALYQARLVQSLLAEQADVPEADRDVAFPVCVFKTSGDKLKGDLSEFGGKGLFTKELEDRLDSGEIDLAVHSMKDVPTTLREDHIIAAMLEREDPRDVFISPRYKSIDNLPDGAVIGTASLRRRAQLAARRPDIRFDLLRGNVGTRIEKLERGDCDGTFLALAGLKRLGRPDAATEIIDLDHMLSAPSQAAIGIEVRTSNKRSWDAARSLNHLDTEVCVSAERAFLKALDGSCRTPIAALAQIEGGKLRMRGERLTDDGQRRWQKQGFLHRFNIETARNLGRTMGEAILSDMAAEGVSLDG